MTRKQDIVTNTKILLEREVLPTLIRQFSTRIQVSNTVICTIDYNFNISVFQDVHVMIFIGFGFLMTFLKKYGLSAVSLNMMLSALAIQWSILVHGFLHPHYDHCATSDETLEKRSADDHSKPLYNTDCNPNKPWIDINLVTLISADFATAAVLITFGVLLGTTSPLQLIIMTIVEILLFNINEVIGRSYLGAVDAGDTIFVHLFGAYFGLAISRVLYDEATTKSEKFGSTRISDMFSMVHFIALTFIVLLFSIIDRDSFLVDVLAKFQLRSCSNWRRSTQSNHQHLLVSLRLLLLHVCSFCTC